MSAEPNRFNPPVAPIAVIGVGCRFPQANGPDGFWQLLKNGVDAISEVPASRWDIEQFYDPDSSAPGKMNTRWGGFLDEVELFDHDFFGIPQREAEKMDPQQRLLLEVAWEALEDAGQAGRQLAKSACGVFVGATNNHFADLQAGRPELIDAFSGTGGATSVIANRISYCLDLRGPSLVVDTACSSSLVAVHLACQSLRTGESYPIALAGGVNVIISPVGTIFFSRAGGMAPDGRTKFFDAGSNGFARSEGAGVVVLKPLAAALEDRDFIYAVIRGGAVNQDGRSNGLMAPNRWSQEAVLREALRRTDARPGDVQYVEAHASGTLLGDTIEASALGAVLAKDRSSGVRCAVGSVKTNFGHLESAAGIAGLIKVALMLRHRMIPPNLHSSKPNPYINFAKLPLRVPTTLEPWPDGESPALAGVSAFGFGGTNAHLLVQEAPSRLAPQPDLERRIHLLTLSARTESLLRELAARFADYFSRSPLPSLPDICFTLNAGRSHFPYRVGIITDSPADAKTQLDAIRAGSNVATNLPTPSASLSKLAFVLPGDGIEYVGLGRELYESQPAFHEAFDECLAAGRSSRLSSSDADLFATAEEFFSHGETEFTQLALFAVQYALIQMWLSWGVRPDALIGVGVGEYVAACVSGILGHEDAFKLVSERARLMGEMEGGGPAMGTGDQFRQLLESIAFSPPKIPVVSATLGRILTVNDCTQNGWPHQMTPATDIAGAIRLLVDQQYALFLELGSGSVRSEIASLNDEPNYLFLLAIGSDSSRGDHWYALLSCLTQLYLRGVAVDWAGFERGYQRYKVSLPTSLFGRKGSSAAR